MKAHANQLPGQIESLIADEADADRLALCHTLLEFGAKTHAAFFASSISAVDVCRALAGMPFSHGSSTG